MKLPDGIARAPGGRHAPLVRISRKDEVGPAIRPGVIVEVEPDAAAACGAWAEDCIDAEEAFEAAEDPADFGGQGGPHGA